MIAHGRSGDDLCCPVLAVARQLVLLRQNCDRLDLLTKLASYVKDRKPVALQAKAFTDVIRLHAALCHHLTGVPPKDYSARSLRAGSAMALLAGKCDSNVIKLQIGRAHV